MSNIKIENLDIVKIVSPFFKLQSDQKIKISDALFEGSKFGVSYNDGYIEINHAGEYTASVVDFVLTIIKK